MTRPGTVLVAGGTGALGTAVLRALIEAGRPVVATWIADDEHDRTAHEFSDSAALRLVRADVTDPASVDNLVAGLPDLGGVVNLVGGYAQTGPVHETRPDDFERMLRLNLLPNFLLARATVARLAEVGGAFVAVSARAAIEPFPGAAGYITAKAGVLTFIRALDTEYGDLGLRANAVLPGVIDTPANRRAHPDDDFDRWVEPAAIAAVVDFLVSEAGSAIRGAAVPVGGR